MMWHLVDDPTDRARQRFLVEFNVIMNLFQETDSINRIKYVSWTLGYDYDYDYVAAPEKLLYRTEWTFLKLHLH
jgi:hypothetical protein